MKNKLQKKLKGITLIELTVVILVLLSLIAVLFIGARAYKEASDRTACILTIRNAQQAGRAWQNLNNIAEGADVVKADIVGTGKFMEVVPPCRAGGAYTWEEKVPATGKVFLTCNKATDLDHKPESTEGW